jgi:hypothetical protein
LNQTLGDVSIYYLLSKALESRVVDDLISGKTTVKEAGELKQRATEIFQDATFT